MATATRQTRARAWDGKQDARRFPRQAVSWLVTGSNGSRQLQGRTKDTSVAGAKILVDERLPLGSQMLLQFRPAGRSPVETQALVFSAPVTIQCSGSWASRLDRTGSLKGPRHYDHRGAARLPVRALTIRAARWRRRRVGRTMGRPRLVGASCAIFAATGHALRPGMPTLLIGLTDLAHEQPLGSGSACRASRAGKTGSRKADSLSAAWSDAARYFILQLAESHLTWSLFRQILQRIARLAGHPT